MLVDAERVDSTAVYCASAELGREQHDAQVDVEMLFHEQLKVLFDGFWRIVGSLLVAGFDLRRRDAHRHPDSFRR